MICDLQDNKPLSCLTALGCRLCRMCISSAQFSLGHQSCKCLQLHRCIALPFCYTDTLVVLQGPYRCGPAGIFCSHLLQLVFQEQKS